LQPSQTLLKTITVVTDNNGDAPFVVGVPLSSVNGPINATATDPAGNTSELFLRPSHLRNLSTRGRVQSGDEALIAGFITGGFSRKGMELIVRAIGPSLSAGGAPLQGRLEDPLLDLRYAQFLLKSNDNWRDNASDATEIQKWGLAPANDLESALVYSTNPSAGTQYTATIQGKNDSAGIGVVEFYEVSGNNLRPVNISTRGLVQPGDDVMIGGFILAGGYGSTAVVVRAIGPSLSNFGVANPLLDPTVELHDGNGAVVASNDDWQETQATELNATGLAPTNPAESAIFALLDPGTYTAVVRGKGASTGVAVVEVYQLP
jgi:hypothetical protein